MSSEISVVIPAYNMDFCIRDCLSGVSRQTLAPERFEVILVDDGSTDQTLLLAQQLQRELALENLKIITQANAGPAAARNRGITLATGEMIAFLDSDCIPEPTWLEHLIAPLMKNPALVGVEGRTVPASEERTLMDHCISNPTGGFYWTCNIAYRKKLLMDIGGFDEGFPLPSGEDIDLAHRMQQKGAIAFEPAATVTHLIIQRSFARNLKTARTFSSMIRLQRKHPGLLTQQSGFARIALYQFKYLLWPIVTQRREGPKNPSAYLKFCLLQGLMALDTLFRLPVYYLEATRPLVVKEPFRSA